MDGGPFVVDGNDDREREVLGYREETELAAGGLAERFDQPITPRASSLNLGMLGLKSSLIEAWRDSDVVAAGWRTSMSDSFGVSGYLDGSDRIS